MTAPLPPLIQTPGPVLAEMTLRWATVSPPIVTPGESTNTPARPLPPVRLTVPGATPM